MKPFRHKVFFAAASDIYRAPGLSLLVGTRHGYIIDLVQCTSKERPPPRIVIVLSKRRQQKRPYDSIRARIFREVITFA